MAGDFSSSRAMAQTPPFRNRPNLYIALPRLTGSPRHPAYATPISSGTSTPNGTPFATTAYSPFRSAGLNPPAPYHTSRDTTPDREKSRYFDGYSWFRTKRLLSSRPLWFLFALLVLSLWWFHRRLQAPDVVQWKAHHLGKQHASEGRTKKLQFFPATNPKIHVCLH